MNPRYWLTWLLALLLLGCGGGGGGGSTTPTPSPGSESPAPAAADISLLFMGNSHSSVNRLPEMVAAMVRSARPGKTVLAVEAPGWMFLDDRSMDPASLALLRGTAWSAVVLQAQKYSSSGEFSYSTAGAQALIRETRGVGALPIMFPEWPRLGVDETFRIYDLHVSIAVKEPACVAPIGQAWDLAFARYPGIVLHASDGNHSAPAGAFLASLVLAATYTKSSPALVPFIADFGVDADMQERLRGVATDTVAAWPPRRWCPADA